MVKSIAHPLRNEELKIYKGEDDCIGLFGNGSYPVYIRGKTPEEVATKGEAFRSSLLQKHEDKYIKNRANIAKMHAARARKRKK